MKTESKQWDAIIQEEMGKDYMQALSSQLKARRAQGKLIYPAANEYFRAFNLTPFNKVRVVILGQEPYNDNNADGLAFSCKHTLSPSLKNIKEELKVEYTMSDDEFDQRFGDNTLEHWASQGVLLLNTCLSVEHGEPGSHAGIGWERFTASLITELYNDNSPKVFMCWGEQAKKIMQAKSGELHNPIHLVLHSAHPSPFSAHKGFFGNNHFRLADNFIRLHYDEDIQWFTVPF